VGSAREESVKNPLHLGSSAAGTMQLAQLLSQFLSSEQQTGSFSVPFDFNRPQMTISSANLCQNKNDWIIDSGATIIWYVIEINY
jgi:hypothetical protein